jgi:hypothetical protein
MKPGDYYRIGTTQTIAPASLAVTPLRPFPLLLVTTKYQGA